MVQSPFQAGKPYYIRNVNSNMSLDVKDQKTKNGTEIWMWTFHGESNQTWNFHDGFIEHSQKKVLDVKYEKGPDVILYTRKSTLSLTKANQQWVVKQVDGKAAGYAPSTAYYIESKLDGKVLTVNQNSLTSGIPVVVAPKYDAATATKQQVRSQLWYIDEATPENKKKFLFHFFDVVQQEQQAPVQAVPLPSEWRDEIPAMFFSWVSYQHYIAPQYSQNDTALETDISGWMIGKVYNEQWDSRLKGYGNWTITNEFHYEYNIFNTHTIVAANKEFKIVVIAHSGTESDDKVPSRQGPSWRDWIFNDFNIEKVSYDKADKSKGRIHEGFQLAYEVIREGVMKQIGSYLDAGYNVIITGHSKGGATTYLNVLDCFEKFADKIASPANQALPTVVGITYGGPRVGDSTFASYFEKTVPSSCFVHYATNYPWVASFKIVDLVSIVPPEILGFKHAYEKNLFYIKADPKNFGNPNPIKEVNVTGSGWEEIFPYCLQVHWQEVYMDGLLAEKGSTDPFVSAIEEKNRTRTIYLSSHASGTERSVATSYIAPEGKEETEEAIPQDVDIEKEVAEFNSRFEECMKAHKGKDLLLEYYTKAAKKHN